MRHDGIFVGKWYPLSLLTLKKILSRYKGKERLSKKDPELTMTPGKEKEPIREEGTHHYACMCDPMDCSPPGSSVHGIFWPRILEWVVTFSRDPLLYVLSLVSALDLPYSSKIPLDTSAEFFPEN